MPKSPVGATGKETGNHHGDQTGEHIYGDIFSSDWHTDVEDRHINQTAAHAGQSGQYAGNGTSAKANYYAIDEHGQVYFRHALSAIQDDGFEY